MIDTYTRDGMKMAAISSFSEDAWNKIGENDTEIAELVKQVSWLYAVHRKRAGAASGLPIELRKGKDDVDKKDWPVKMDLPDLMYRYSLATDLYGENYMFQVQRNRVTESIRWFAPSTINIEQNDRKGLVGFTRTLGAKKKLYPVIDGKSRVMWTWLPGLEEVGPGTPPADVVLDAANILRYMTLTSKGFFENGAVDKWIMFGPQSNIPEKAQKRFLDWWNRMFFSGSNKPMRKMEILSPDSRIESVSSPIGEWTLPDLNDMQAEQICVAHDTPLMLLRPNEGADKAMMKETKLAWTNEAVIPHAQRMIDTLNEQLFEELGYEFVINAESMNVNQEEEHLRSESVANLVKAGETLDNAYKILGYDIPDDLEERPEETEPEPPPMPLQADVVEEEAAKSWAWNDEKRQLTNWLKNDPARDIENFKTNHLTDHDKAAIAYQVGDGGAARSDAPFPGDDRNQETYP